MQITDKERRVSTITMEQPWEPGPFFSEEVGANLVRVVIGHSGVKTIVFLHKKSAIRTFVGDCCSETSGGRGEVPGQTIGDIHTDVLSTQHYSAPSPSSRPICHRETSHPHKQTCQRCLKRFRMGKAIIREGWYYSYSGKLASNTAFTLPKVNNFHRVR